MTVRPFRISLCWQFTYLHNLAWTFLGHIYRIILVYETEKYAIYFRLPVLSHWYLSKRVWVKFMTWEWNYVKLIMVFELINMRWLGKPSACTPMLNLKRVQSGAKPLPDTLLLALDDYSRQPRAPVQPEAKPLPDDHTLTLDDETKRAPAPVQGTRHFRNVSTPSIERCAFSD